MPISDSRLRREGRGAAFAGASATDAAALCRYTDSRRRTVWLEAFIAERIILDAAQTETEETDRAAEDWVNSVLYDMDEAADGETAERVLLRAIYDLIKRANF